MPPCAAPPRSLSSGRLPTTHDLAYGTARYRMMPRVSSVLDASGTAWGFEESGHFGSLAIIPRRPSVYGRALVRQAFDHLPSAPGSYWPPYRQRGVADRFSPPPPAHTPGGSLCASCCPCTSQARHHACLASTNPGDPKHAVASGLPSPCTLAAIAPDALWSR